MFFFTKKNLRKTFSKLFFFKFQKNQTIQNDKLKCNWWKNLHLVLSQLKEVSCFWILLKSVWKRHFLIARLCFTSRVRTIARYLKTDFRCTYACPSRRHFYPNRWFWSCPVYVFVLHDVWDWLLRKTLHRITCIERDVYRYDAAYGTTN